MRQSGKKRKAASQKELKAKRATKKKPISKNTGYWNKECQARSEKLWLPTECDSLANKVLSGVTPLTNEKPSWWTLRHGRAKHSEEVQRSWRKRSFVVGGECKREEFAKLSKAKVTQIKKESGEEASEEAQLEFKTQRNLIRARLVQLLPTSQQRILLNQCFADARATYNAVLRHVRDHPKDKINKMTLRNMFVTEANLKALQPHLEYAIRTPKSIRDRAVQDLVDAYNSNFQKQKLRKARGEKTFKFRVKFKSKRKPNDSIGLEGCNLQTSSSDSKQARLFVKRWKELGVFALKEDFPSSYNSQDFRIIKRHDLFFLALPYFRQTQPGDSNEKEDLEDDTDCKAMDDEQPIVERHSVVSLDPGVRTFQTFYSPEGFYGEIAADPFARQAIPSGKQRTKGQRHDLTKLLFRQDKLKSMWKEGSLQQQRRRKKAWHKLQSRVTAKIDDLHWKAAKWLVTRFETVLIPDFQVSNMVRKEGICRQCQANGELHVNRACSACGGSRKIKAKTVRQMLTLRMSTFKARLIQKSAELNCKVHVVGEEYTTQTCARCGWLHTKIGGSKMYHCQQCRLKVGRDFAGSFNIFLSNTTF